MKTYLKLWLTALFWAGAFVAGKHVSEHLGPFAIAFLRFGLASLLLLAMVRWKYGVLPRLDRGQIVVVLLLGATGVFAYNAMFFKALSLIEAGRASVVVATSPAFIAIGSAVFFKERLGWVRSLGVLLSVFGAAVVVSRGNLREVLAGGVGLGEALILGCVLSWSAYSLIGKTVMRSLSPLVAVSYSVAIGSLALFVGACIEGLGRSAREATALDWLAIVYMAVFATVVGFVWFYEGVRQIGPTRASLCINFVPVFAVLLAFLLLGEPLTVSLALGAALVLSGTYLTSSA
ncbi:MAG: DMT family transporter [Sedimentisphaerales bacterium]|jgi:drug/metabolite transporter (DMT)-like permease|nr:DMT family transporter [Sedimentisphaerales bacterium]HNY79497.1 DMT family transporter [Sedimentisphaerales bacterium]HOC62371.1 DMT family transporter [Sedimentisphaerales bacterium]HOH65479.1 DMT family transporter [Sedimentisphaerales bacterium]HPY51327.1 DMT family transporter [Sedimentisphaerales bacterium]